MEREVVLADFQEVTGIADIDVCLEHLEKTNWDLLNAIHRALPQHSQALPSEQLPTEHHNHFTCNNISQTRMDPWTGATQDDELPLNVPSHDDSKVVTTVSTPSVVNTNTAHSVDAETSDQSDVEDLTESYNDEDFGVPETNSSKDKLQRYLIPDNIDDETTGTILFYESFLERYGHCHPMFFHGSLEQAIREATHHPAKDRKLLAMYLHHDGSVMANIFCQQVLCSEAVVNMLSSNFVAWGWDCTYESNRQRLLNSVSRNFGTPAVAAIRNFDKDRYPVIILISKTRSSTEICSIIPGSNTCDEVLINLLHTVEQYRAQQAVEIREEEEREARERVIQEQNLAYQESLQADMAKEEAKKELERKKKREQDEKQAQQEQLAADRERVGASLPEEPQTNDKGGVCTLRCRFPNGKIASRKFLQSAPLKTLYDFLFSQGFEKERYKILFSHPKRDVTEMHVESVPLGEVFNAQDTVILESR